MVKKDLVLRHFLIFLICTLIYLPLVHSQVPLPGKIINIGPPINTHKDDFSPSLTADGKTMIFNSKRAGNYQNIYIMLNMFNVGVTDFLSVGAGFDFISMFSRFDDEWHPVFNFNTKLGFRVADKVHVGAGALVITSPGIFNAGIPYSMATFGSYNSNFTTGIGWGFVDGEFQQNPFIMFGGMARISEKLWFVSENWIWVSWPNASPIASLKRCLMRSLAFDIDSLSSLANSLLKFCTLLSSG